MILPDPGIIGFLLTTASESGHGGFDWGFVIKHAVNLVILIGVLVYFTKDTVKKFLEDRRTNLSKEIDEAQQTIDEANERHKEYSAKLDNLESEIASLKESIQKQGETEKREIIEQANTSAEIIKKEARDMMKLEANKVKKQLQTDIINSSLKEAEEIIKKHFEEKESRNTVDQFVNKVEEDKWLQ